MPVKVIYEHTLHVLKLTAEPTLNKQGVLAIFWITHFAYAVFTKFLDKLDVYREIFTEVRLIDLSQIIQTCEKYIYLVHAEILMVFAVPVRTASLLKLFQITAQRLNGNI